MLPCNATHSKHRFLAEVLQKKKIVIGLNSVAGDFVKPTTPKSLDNMNFILKAIDASCNLDEWPFLCNSKDDTP